MTFGSSLNTMCKSVGDRILAILTSRHRRLTRAFLLLCLVASSVHLISVIIFGRTSRKIHIPPLSQAELQLLRPLTWMELSVDHVDVQGGKSDVPLDAVVIVPYRKREQHLRVLLHVLHSFLPLQNLRYRIVVVELGGQTQFNRALLLNIGVVEARRLFNVSCFVLHDVDLIPLNPGIQYRCASNPKHLSVAIDKFEYKLPWPTLFGGACALTWDQLRSVNGMPNIYFGWGGEDDDFYRRLISKKWKIERESEETARYTMLRHKSDKNNPPNRKRFQLRKGAVERMHRDGLSSLRYRLEGLEFKQLFVFIQVSVDEQDKSCMLNAAFQNVSSPSPLEIRRGVK